MHGGGEKHNGSAALTSQPKESEPGKQRILFLQGPLSPLYRLMGRELQKAGVDVLRINLCFGDWLHWHGRGTTSFRGKPEAWPGFIDRFIRTEGITDLVLHGDQRLYHKAAIDAAFHEGARIYVTELGMLRSGWMTLERNGLSTLSCFPDKPDEIRKVAEAVGPIDLTQSFPKSTWLEIAPDVIYNLSNVFLRPLYPHFQRHTIHHPIPEYLRGGMKMLRQAALDRRARDEFEKARKTRAPLYLFPLQLEGDFQLRAHSPFKSFRDVLDLVLTSFAENAGRTARLLIKTHPLDVGFQDWSQEIANLARRRGVAGRVHFLDGGRLSEIFPALEGVVTLNSTAGLEALQAGISVKSLMPAHYDIEGLTHGGSLNSFWEAPEKPDMDLLDAYCRALAGTIQVPGSIHNREGTRVAARNMARRILEQSVNEPGAYVVSPPRLERARALGVQL